jgi:hypothetical protein
MAHSGLSFASGAAIYATGQITNFAFQLLLLQQLGQSLYAEVGLAHLLILSTLFIADLGYSSLFLRESPDAPGWNARWRKALLHRLTLTLLLDAAVLLGWLLSRGVQSDGFAYLLSALPATLLGLINYSAPLLAQGRRHTGFMLQQVAWPTALMASLTVLLSDTPLSASTAGALVSLGFGVQAAVNLYAFGSPHLLLPSLGKRERNLLGSALQLSMIGIAGTLHERLTPFLIAQLAPSFTATYLLLSHALNGASGIFNQFNRLLLVESKGAGARWAGYLSTLLLAGLATGLLLVLVAWTLWPETPLLHRLDLLIPLMLGWTVITIGGLASALAIGHGRERQLLQVMFFGLLASTLWQLMAFAMESASGVLWGRALVMLGTTLAALRLSHLGFTSSSYVLLAYIFINTWIIHHPSAWLVNAILLPFILLWAYRRPQGLQERRAIHPPQAQSPAEFQQALADHYGAEVSRLRHELFFIRQRTGLMRNLRCLLAAMRDAGYCLSLPRQSPHLPAVTGVASLPGSSGREALEPCLQNLQERGCPTAIVIHPRLRSIVSGSCPARPSLKGWISALHAWITPLPAKHQAPIESWPVRCTLFRHRLWLAAWRCTLAQQAAGGTLLLHNDFDLFAVAAIEAGRGSWRSLCVQHGLPTDEFAPPRADRQLVWGDSSQDAYLALGFPPANLLRGPSKPLPPSTEPVPSPAAICIVSQTHTPIFGRSLKADFIQLAQYLHADDHYGQRLQILLHPEECRQAAPYPATLAHLCRRPPHDILRPGSAPCIVLGFCSTALLDAARYGHLVIGLDWQAPGSIAARKVGQPLIRVADCQALRRLLDELMQHEEQRQILLKRQRDWLEDTFKADDQWLDWVSSTR